MKPIIKWVGGKSSSLKILSEYIFTASDGVYVEPFLGGASLLFTYKPRRAYVNDINPNLMIMYWSIKQNSSQLVNCINTLSTTYNSFKSLGEKQSMFDNLRTKYNKIKYNNEIDLYTIDDIDKRIEISSLFIFLNKTCFNGLYRENMKGEFNVPFGKKTTFDIDETNLIDISNYFNQNDITLSCTSYENVINTVKTYHKNKLVTLYMDPPYYKCTESKFTTYSNLYNFDNSSHEKMYTLIKNLQLNSNWHIICSNSFDETIIKHVSSFGMVTRPLELNRNMDKKIAKEIISYTPNSKIWKNLIGYLNGNSTFKTTDIEKDFISMYSTSVLLNSTSRTTTFNIGKLGELNVKRMFNEFGIDFKSCPYKENVRPDGFIELPSGDKYIVEIKSRTYTCTGTASEKIDCIPRKLSIFYKKYDCKSLVIFVAGQINEKSGKCFLTEDCEYIKKFKLFSKVEAGIDDWISIDYIKTWLDNKLNNKNIIS